jgi:type IV secretion system protein TrbL
MLFIISYFIFLGNEWVVTQNGPQIAVTILNGTPQLSMGEFLHAAGTAAASAAMAKRAATAGGNALKTGGISVGGGYPMDKKAKDNSRMHVDSEQAARSMGYTARNGRRTRRPKRRRNRRNRQGWKV